MNELDGQLSLFEPGEAVTMRVYDQQENLLREYQVADWVTWNDGEEEPEDL